MKRPFGPQHLVEPQYMEGYLAENYTAPGRRWRRGILPRSPQESHGTSRRRGSWTFIRCSESPLRGGRREVEESKKTIPIIEFVLGRQIFFMYFYLTHSVNAETRLHLYKIIAGD